MIRKTPSDKKAVVHKNKTKTAEIALNHVTRSLSTHNEEENLASLLGAGDDDVDKQEMGAEMNKSIELSKQDSTTKRKSKLAALDSAINVKDNWDNVNLFYYYGFYTFIALVIVLTFGGVSIGLSFAFDDSTQRLAFRLPVVIVGSSFGIANMITLVLSRKVSKDLLEERSKSTSLKACATNNWVNAAIVAALIFSLTSGLQHSQPLGGREDIRMSEVFTVCFTGIGSICCVASILLASIAYLYTDTLSDDACESFLSTFPYLVGRPIIYMAFGILYFMLGSITFLYINYGPAVTFMVSIAYLIISIYVLLEWYWMSSFKNEIDSSRLADEGGASGADDDEKTELTTVDGLHFQKSFKRVSSVTSATDGLQGSKAVEMRTAQTILPPPHRATEIKGDEGYTVGAAAEDGATLPGQHKSDGEEEGSPIRTSIANPLKILSNE